MSKRVPAGPSSRPYAFARSVNHIRRKGPLLLRLGSPQRQGADCARREPDREGPAHPYLRRDCGGAAWQKTSNEGRDYLSMKLDDPSFPAPIYSTLVEVQSESDLQLIWSGQTGTDLAATQRPRQHAGSLGVSTALEMSGSTSPTHLQSSVFVLSGQGRLQGRRRRRMFGSH
jgi:Protein of unknown function (DUF736)